MGVLELDKRSGDGGGAGAGGSGGGGGGGHAEDYSSLLKANRANLASAVKLSPIKRRRHFSHSYSQLHPPPPPAQGDAAHKHKKPKTVHFQRPVVTGGAGAGRGLYEDGDDDLEIC